MAELDRLDKIWRQKQERDGQAFRAISQSRGVGIGSTVELRASLDSDTTRVEGRYVAPGMRLDYDQQERQRSGIRSWLHKLSQRNG